MSTAILCGLIILITLIIMLIAGVDRRCTWRFLRMCHPAYHGL